jgi:hypothetical protein
MPGAACAAKTPCTERGSEDTMLTLSRRALVAREAANDRPQDQGSRLRLEEGQACSEIDLCLAQSCKEAIKAGSEIVEEREAANMSSHWRAFWRGFLDGFTCWMPQTKKPRQGEPRRG